MKKKHQFFNFFEFFIVFFAFVVPSFVVKSQDVIVLDVAYAPMPILLQLSIGIYLVLRLYDEGLLSKTKLPITLRTFLIVLLQSLTIFSLLLCVGLVFNTSGLFNTCLRTEITSTPPDSFFMWIWFFVSISILAFFEEVIFRRFLPEKALLVLRKSHFFLKISELWKTIFTVIVELVFILLFALGHKYMGIIPIVTAFISGTILRVSVKKCNSMIPACIAHSINNISSFIVLFYFV